MSQSGLATLAAIVGLAIACGAIAPPSGSPAPLNTCQTDQDCADYGPGPTLECLLNRCQVTQSQGNWTAVVSLAPNAPYGAGSTFATLFNALFPGTVKTPAGDVVCQGSNCAQLPPLVTDNNSQSSLSGDLRCLPQVAIDANYNLGFTPSVPLIALPVRATFVPKWGNAPYVDAASLGLPLMPVVADTIPNQGADQSPGPGLGPGMEFWVAGGLPPLVYERILSPLPPFDRAYPPDVSLVGTPSSPLQDESAEWKGFDSTLGTSGGAARGFPTVAFERADGGPLDGWTAYLRDVLTLRPFSQVADLSGTHQTVVLLTNHHPPLLAGSTLPDALTGAQLVMVPPPTELLPTWIYNAVNDEAAGWGTYPKLPPPISVALQVVDAAGKPAPADLVLEAIDICRYAAGIPAPVHDLLSANHDFSYVVRTSAPEGAVEVELPLGGYRVTAVPRGAGAALTVLTPFAIADTSCNPINPKKIELAAQTLVTGTAAVADGRPLADATVELVPTACADSEVDPDCLPRGTQTTTTTGGTYALEVDPGAYRLRVRPAEGSGLPWVVQSLSVASPSTTSPTLTAPVTTVPAPWYDGPIQLFDGQGDPAADAIVRIFENPMSGPPYEIGEAVTEVSGHFDMYLDPAAQ